MTMLTVPYALGQLGVSGDPDPFQAVGFSVSSNGLLAALNGALAFSGVGDGHEFLGVGAVGDPIPAGANVDGIAVVNSQTVPPADHDNGSYELDHVVILTPDLDQTARHVEAVLGLGQLRLREQDGQRQSFHRFADVKHPDGSSTKGCIVELVADDRVATATLWGVVFNTYQLDEVTQRYGPDIIGPARPAVQKGRRIAAFQPAAGLGVQVALMTPVPTGDGDVAADDAAAE